MFHVFLEAPRRDEDGPVDVGDDGVFACMLGGPDGRTLYACVAPDYDAENRAAAREARMPGK